jgi:hypothetical protein
MLKFTTLISILFSLNAVASTNGGGVLMNAAYSGGGVGLRPEIVFNMGELDGTVRFSFH